MWKGQTVAVYASGPSMNGTIRAKTQHLPAIAVNDTYRLAPDADMLYAADESWWQQYPEAKFFPGLKVSIGMNQKAKPLFDDQLLLLYSGEDGFDECTSNLRTGGNSGYQAVHIAIHAKARRILMFGFDMHGKNGLHWFGRHPAPLRNTVDYDFQKRVIRFRALAEAAKTQNVEIINCCLGSAIDAFPIRTLDEVI